ncbi:MAG: CbtA family protein [Methylococcales bacterium]
MYFRNLVLSAFIIAIVVGAIFSIYQAVFITPIIIDSEVYEVLEPATNHVEAWAPEDGLERGSWSFVTNFLLCFSYGLVLLSVMATQTSVTAVKGLLWGTAAYISFFVAPSLGLPPEIPGMEAANLEGRQSWWLLTVILTVIALWLIAFYSPISKFVGILLLLIPHFIGAPQPEIDGFINTDPKAIEALTQLWHNFIIQTSLANALLWLLIGGLSGYLVEKFIYSIDNKNTGSV